jgi:hypothetical protein
MPAQVGSGEAFLDEDLCSTGGVRTISYVLYVFKKKIGDWLLEKYRIVLCFVVVIFNDNDNDDLAYRSTGLIGQRLKRKSSDIPSRRKEVVPTWFISFFTDYTLSNFRWVILYTN